MGGCRDFFDYACMFLNSRINMINSLREVDR